MTEISVELFDSKDKAFRILKQVGYQLSDQYINHDIYFSHINNPFDVSYKTLIDNSFIIRNIKGNDCDIRQILYKKKIFDSNGNVVDETKTKIKIDDIDHAKKLFGLSGLNCWCDYKVENYEFVNGGGITLDVQIVPNLGTFLEIEEFDGLQGSTDEEKFEALKSIVDSLPLKHGKDYSCKKPFLMLHKKEKTRAN